MKPIIFSAKEIRVRLKAMPGWKFAHNKISKKFEFKDFMDSLGFIKSLAPFCEKVDHHPDIHLLYSKIIFELQRFDVGGKVTDKDFLVATKIEELYTKRKK